MTKKIRAAFLSLIAALTGGLSHADVPANPFDYSKTVVFTYDNLGRVQTTVLEPLHGGNCSVKTTNYGATGLPKDATASNCSGATGSTVFATRTTSNGFAGTSVTIGVDGTPTQVSYPDGVFVTATTNAKLQVATATFDPRFGTPLTQTTPAGVIVSFQYDDFGRAVQNNLADGTIARVSYCALINGAIDVSVSANSADCPTSFQTGEILPDAATLIVNRSFDAAGVALIAPVKKTYGDKLGRTIRTATTGFDGPGQPAGLSGTLVVQDTTYGPTGAVVLATAPYFLALGSTRTAGANDAGATLTVYDRLGRPTLIYVADAAGQHSANFGDGNLGGTRTASLSTNTYSALQTTVVNDLGQIKSLLKNALDKDALVTDAFGGQVAFQYDGFGNALKTQDAVGNTISAAFDFVGNRVGYSDPDAGTSIAVFDAIGELVSSQTAKQISTATNTSYGYDVLGRRILRTEDESITTWYFDADASGASCMAGRTSSAGALCEIKVSNGLNRKFAYDSAARLVSSRMDAGNVQNALSPSFASAWSYAANTGRLASRTYPSGLQVAYGYTANGYPAAVTLGNSTTLHLTSLPGTQAVSSSNISPNAVLWQLQRADAMGGTEGEMLGNGVSSTHIYDKATHRLQAASAGTGGSVQSQGFTWDSVGNVSARADAIGDGVTGAVSETFAYDALNRLREYAVAGAGIQGQGRTVGMTYNAIGLMLNKTDVGNYAYPANASARAHSPTSVAGIGYTYDTNGNQAAATGGGKYSALTYTSFDRVATARNVDNSVNYAWLYDDEHMRVKEVRNSPGIARTTWYLDVGSVGELFYEYETDTGTSPNTAIQRNFIVIGGRTVGVIASASAQPALAPGQMSPPVAADQYINKIEYWHVDHLGSLVATTDHNGAVTQRYAYDPFGKRRVSNGAYDPNGILVYDWNPDSNNGTARGFTGHEELDDIGIVNMNGRIYNGNIAMFMQPDPVISDLYNLQSYARYAYLSNNPLNATDPSGLSSSGYPGGFDGSVYEGAEGPDMSPQQGPQAVSSPKPPTSGATEKSSPVGNSEGSSGELQFVTDIKRKLNEISQQGSPRSKSGERKGTSILDTPSQEYRDAVYAGRAGSCSSPTKSCADVRAGERMGEHVRRGFGSPEPGLGHLGDETVNAATFLFVPEASLAKFALEGIAAKEITLSRSLHGEAAAHAADAIKAGKPSVLTIDRGGAAANRQASTGALDKVTGKHLDEYPPAMFREGGAGASVRPISPRDNMSSGACIGNACRGLPNGTRVQIKIGD